MHYALEQAYLRGRVDERERMWIPCSEKLPNEEGKYLCDIGSGDYAVGNYTKEYGWIFKHYVKECNAWQPLPPKFEG